MSGTVYLLCWAEGTQALNEVVAAHYVGHTEHSAEAQLALDVAGDGSQFVAAAARAGREVALVRTWTPADPFFLARLMRNHKGVPGYCPPCVQAGRAEATEALP